MEGRRKEVVLLVLAVLALGIALYTFRGNKPAPGPGPAATAAAPAPGVAGEPGNEQAATEEALGTEGGASAATGGGRQRNPFSAPGTVAVETTPNVTEGAGPMADAAPATGETSLMLTGIIDGKQSVAILRQDDQRFFVKVGDLVGEGYRVQSIGRQQVVLAGQQGKVILRMGGRQ